MEQKFTFSNDNYKTKDATKDKKEDLLRIILYRLRTKDDTQTTKTMKKQASQITEFFIILN